MRHYLLILVICLACLPQLNADNKRTLQPNQKNQKDDFLTVHLIPHSHDDVGWLKSIDGYFYKSVSHSRYNDKMGSVNSILTTMVAALFEEPDRRFAWSEFKYFEKWWKIQKEHRRNQVRNLLESKQLEFVNGGWSSHDEACPTF